MLYIYKHAGININFFNTNFSCTLFALLLTNNTSVLESKHPPSSPCLISAMKWEKWFYYAHCGAIYLETWVLLLIQCLCISWNKQKEKKNRRELRNSSSSFNWKQCSNYSIWLRWHLFIVYCSFGNNSHNSLVQNALILLIRRADKKAQISQGFRAALGWLLWVPSLQPGEKCGWEQGATVAPQKLSLSSNQNVV